MRVASTDDGGSGLDGAFRRCESFRVLVIKQHVIEWLAAKPSKHDHIRIAIKDNLVGSEGGPSRFAGPIERISHLFPAADYVLNAATSRMPPASGVKSWNLNQLAFIFLAWNWNHADFPHVHTVANPETMAQPEERET